MIREFYPITVLQYSLSIAIQLICLIKSILPSRFSFKVAFSVKASPCNIPLFLMLPKHILRASVSTVICAVITRNLPLHMDCGLLKSRGHGVVSVTFLCSTTALGAQQVLIFLFRLSKWMTTIAWAIPYSKCYESTININDFLWQVMSLHSCSDEYLKILVTGSSTAPVLILMNYNFIYKQNNVISWEGCTKLCLWSTVSQYQHISVLKLDYLSLTCSMTKWNADVN